MSTDILLFWIPHRAGYCPLVRDDMQNIVDKTSEWLNSQRERWVLWLPIGLSLGMLAYFGLPFEPDARSLFGLPCLLVWWRWLVRRGSSWRWAMLAIMILAIGFASAKFFTDRQPHRLLEKDIKFATMTGQLIEVADVVGGLRLTLDHVSIEGLAPEQTPTRVRVSLRGTGHKAITGQWVRLRGGLMPPTGPVMPGAFNFARFFYFRGIGAVGYVIPPVTSIQAAPAAFFDDMELALTAFRERLSARIRAPLKPVEGAIAAALMTGDRAAIPDNINNAMRDANLSHILSISGLHMVMMSGIIFFTMRLLLVLNPLTQHGFHNKKIAAIAALIVTGLYLLVSGLPASAVRAYIMVVLVLGAIIFDREVMPLRSLAWAAIALLLFNPSYVLEPGFQLSFFATAGLIAWYEHVRVAADRALLSEHYVRRMLIYIGGVLTTSFVAEAITAPFILYHFNSITLYGALANLLVEPLSGFVIMPSMIVAFLAMPFGLEEWPLDAMQWGISGMVWVAQMVSDIPYARSFFPALTDAGMVLAMLGWCWMMIWHERGRWLGVALVFIGISSMMWAHMPDLLISRDGKQIAARVDGELVAIQGRRMSFVPQQWANGYGMKELNYIPKNHPDFKCDALGCVAHVKGKVIAIPKTDEALLEDCNKADVVLMPYALGRRNCKADVVIDARMRDAKGGHWLWLDNDGHIRVGNTVQAQGARAWNITPPRLF